jgi:hypothetical protein
MTSSEGGTGIELGGRVVAEEWGVEEQPIGGALSPTFQQPPVCPSSHSPNLSCGGLPSLPLSRSQLRSLS